MIFNRITLRGNLVYENVEIISDPSNIGVNTYVAGQVTFRCKDGVIAAPAFHIVYLQLNTHRKKFNNSCTFIKYLTLSSDNVFSNICVLDKKYHEEYGVPVVFKPPMEQFVFACLHGMYLVNSFHIIQIIP